MPAKDRLTKNENIGTTPREIDFVQRFARNWEHLRDIFGVTRFILQYEFVIRTKCEQQ